MGKNEAILKKKIVTRKIVFIEYREPKNILICYQYLWDCTIFGKVQKTYMFKVTDVALLLQIYMLKFL